MLLRFAGQKYPSSRYEKGIKNGLGQPYCLATRYKFRASLDQSGTSSKTKTLAWDGKAHRPHLHCRIMQKTAAWLWGGEENGETPVFTKRFYEFIPGEGSFCPCNCFFGLAKRRARNPHTAKVEGRGGERVTTSRKTHIRLKVLDLFEFCRTVLFRNRRNSALRASFKPGAQIFSGVAWNVGLSINKTKMFIDVDFKSKVFLACEQTLRGALEEEGELTTTSLEVEYLAKMTLIMTSLPLQRVFQCLFTLALVSASRWLVEIWQLSRRGATGELEVEFKFQKRSCKLSFSFPPCRQSAPESLLSG